MCKSILVVDDEEDIRELISFQLKHDGYDVYSAVDGMDAFSKIRQINPDLMIIDVMMPRLGGLELIEMLKKNDKLATIPIIIASAKTGEEDIVKGLDIGADDYITKPFSLKVLSAKVKAQFRRNKKNDDSLIVAGILNLNELKHTCTLKDEEIDLSATEFAMLQLMAKEPGRVFTRNQLINDTKGSDYPVTERSVDVQIVSLRKKLGSFGKNHLKTVWGIGYKLEI